MNKFTMICKTSQHHLRNIGNIKKFLDQGSAKTLVHSFVTSMINYCNALLFGLPKYQSNRLQLAGGFDNHRRPTTDEMRQPLCSEESVPFFAKEEATITF